MPVPTMPHRSRDRAAVPRKVLDARTARWPVGLLLLLVAIGTWQADADRPREPAGRPAQAELAPRAFGDLRLEVPRSWRTLERAEGHVTWGAADRSHLVTLASTEAAPEPLLAVVRELARETRESLPGGRVVAGPTSVDAGPELRRGDSFVLVELEVDVGGVAGPLHVVQAWRRDARAATDVVATWTSTDGTWPVDPRAALPRVDGAPAR